MKPCFTLTKASNLEVIKASVEKTTHQGYWDKIISTSTGSTICPSSRQHISRFGVFDEFHKESSLGFYSLSLQDIGPLVAGDICGHETGIKRPIQLNQTEFATLHHILTHGLRLLIILRDGIFWASNFLLNPNVPLAMFKTKTSQTKRT